MKKVKNYFLKFYWNLFISIYFYDALSTCSYQPCGSQVLWVQNFFLSFLSSDKIWLIPFRKHIWIQQTSFSGVSHQAQCEKVVQFLKRMKLRIKNKEKKNRWKTTNRGIRNKETVLKVARATITLSFTYIHYTNHKEHSLERLVSAKLYTIWDNVLETWETLVLDREKSTKFAPRFMILCVKLSPSIRWIRKLRIFCHLKD